MKNTEYFTPQIEDIRVGYECRQVNTFFKANEWDSEETWTELKPLTEDGLKHIFRIYNNPAKFLRVPYLTKEQIEAEGWEFNEIHLGDVYYNRSPYTLVICPKRNVKIIVTGSSGTKFTIFNGECKDINTFRYICKLLNI